MLLALALLIDRIYIETVLAVYSNSLASDDSHLPLRGYRFEAKLGYP